MSVLLLAFLFATSPLAIAAERNEPTGIWLDSDEEVAVQIFRCAGNLCGRIVWLEDRYNDNGRPKRDRHNPDPKKRDRPLCGLRVLRGLEQTGSGTWEDGQIYNPENGQTYQSEMTLAAPDKLKVRGYIWFSLFGRTMVWTRMEDPPTPCDPSIQFPSPPTP